MRNLPDSEGTSTVFDDGQTSSTPSQARADVLAAFALGLSPGSLANDALTYPDTLFKRTVQEAIRRGFRWKKGEESTNFALRVVEHIAAQAKYTAGNGKVTKKMLNDFETQAIRYWKDKCEIQGRVIFCVLYDANGNYTGPKAEAD